MTKKYKLLKDLPDGSKPGDIYALIESSDKVYKNESMSGRGKVGWTSVENNPEWFEEVKEQERIEVSMDGIDITTPKHRYDLYSSHLLSGEKFPAIKQAIEDVLNPRPRYKVPDDIDKYCQSALRYTQIQLDKAIEDAFAAAREATRLGSYLYPKISDYKAAITNYSK